MTTDAPATDAPTHRRTDQDYVGLPWKSGGFDRAGVDCRGLTLLWLREQLGINIEVTPPLENATCADQVLGASRWKGGPLTRGDVVFFAHFKTRQLVHCAIYLGEEGYLHALKGCESRIVRDHTLLSRMQLVPAGVISPNEAQRLCQALADPQLGEVVTWVMIIVSVLLSIASYALAPKLSRQGNKYGRYSDTSIVTQTSPEIPLPDFLGKVVTAGNSVYTQFPDRNSTLSATSKWNKIVVLGSAPFEEIDAQAGLLINGMPWNASHWNDGSGPKGFFLNPDQTKDEAVSGSIDTGTAVPSITLYSGAHAISVPVDIRAQYDRGFPVYGLSGTGYLVFRFVDWNKFTNFNVTCRVKGRKCRKFDSAGFVQTTATDEDLTGADGVKVRFKLAFDDILSVTTLTVDAVSYSEISSTQQTGNVYRLNKLKGYIEFITAPAAATITITYIYYPREWTQNPAMQLVYLLTEKTRGKGFEENRIDWASAVAFRDYCDEQIVIQSANGQRVAVRYQSNYAVDFRKPVQEHMRAVLDACYGYLFISSGKWVLKARRDGTSVFSFTQSNILRDSFMSGLVDRADRANRVKVIYHSEESFNAETEIIRDDRDDQRDREPRMGNDGIADENLKFPAVTNQEQAERLGDIFLAEQVSSVRQCSFRTNIKGLPLEPGDLVDVTHSAEPSWAAKLFRVEDLSYDADDRLELKLSEYSSAVYTL